LASTCLIPFTTFWARFASRIALLARDRGRIVRDIASAASIAVRSPLMTAPGLWLQRITTQPPSDEQAQCAIVALESGHGYGKINGGEW